MNKSLSVLFDKVGLHSLHRKKSLHTQFRNDTDFQASKANRNRASFYKLIEIPNILFELADQKDSLSGSFYYNSPIHSGDMNNDIARGMCYLSQNDEEPVHAIIVHGWRSDSLNKFKSIFLKKMQNKGYNVYFPTLPYHFDRASTSLYSGEYLISADVCRTITAIKQAVVEIRALIQWLKQNKGGKVILIGISLGGYISNLVSLYEKEIDVLVSIMYANNLSYEIWHTPIGKHIKQDLKKHSFTYEQLQECWSILRADEGQPMIPKEKILLISGKYDQYVTEKDAKKLWSAWSKPQRLLYPCGHAGIIFHRKQIAKDTIDFIEASITNGSE
ncbi:dienelactone hydrolase [Evansella vedderi]|uniref:Dienelactone hydrolase n=1 Tax=Evansella vedderi TaxID=38282 RepID=A0ABT9ZZM6_9BACI|nr:alpha/beta hydrolase family protein [Evansella vedderi]MDQ0256415.1 dienelactone hydrolase [Evansella vedderi]